MTAVPVGEMLRPLLLKQVEGEVRGEVTGLAYHSSRVEPGNLFFSLSGRRAHGWQFAREALDRGALALVVDRESPLQGLPLVRVADVRLALAVLADRFFRHPSRLLRLVGVTGTNGKTTTTHLIDAIFRSREEVTGLLGTIGYRLGRSMLPASATTPEASDLQKMLSALVREGARYVTMEVSSHALELGRVKGCRFAVAVLTNITGEHLDFHHTFEAYLAAKTKLFTSLAGGLEDGRGPRAAVLNADDPYCAFVAGWCPAQVVTYGIENRADVRARDIKFDAGGMTFYADTFAGGRKMRLSLTGMFNVYNALAAIAVGLVEGFTLEEIAAALQAFGGVPGRFERVEQGQDFMVVVDYAHTPDGLENVLRTARRLTRNRLLTVFGCGGERDRSKRPEMGQVAARYSDFFVITNDNPRGEDPWQIIEEIIPGLEGRRRGKEYLILPDRREAIAAALTAARPGDTVVIAGKGHEDYQVLGDITIPFSDAGVAREILASLSNKGEKH